MPNSPAHSRILTPRRIRQRVEVALQDTRVVLIAGPRQAGKTTLAREFESLERPYFTLDDLATLQGVRSDPVGFVRALDMAVIDEVQRAPDLLLVIKQSVDIDQRPGRFLLTGSANLSTIPMIADSLAGRMETIPLLPFAQCEVERSGGRFLDLAFGPGIRIAPDVRVRGRTLEQLVLRGGYPEAVRRKDGLRRRDWYEAYVTQILERDVRDIAAIDQPGRVGKLLSVLAEHAGQLTNHASFGAALGLSGVTAGKYVSILERLFLTKALPPWSSNRLSRLVKSPKIHFLDSGLLASIRGDDEERFAADRTRFGPLLESFVYAEIVKLASFGSGRYVFSHFRTREGQEVDLVIEDRRGRIVGIEVKASATVRADDFKGLKLLREAAGEKFVRGVVLHDHDQVVPFGENLQTAPVSALWLP